MKVQIGIVDRVACIFIGIALFIMGLVLVVLGVTWLPVIGILLALPVLALASNWFRPEAWAVTKEKESEAPGGVSDVLTA
jgi:CHASE2 domain-containing sensor protein